MTRPNTATPLDATMIQLLGGVTYRNVTVTRDQMKNLRRIYGFKNNEISDPDIQRLHEAGDNRNVFRYTNHDGLRVMALLSKYLEPNEDPVTFIAQALADAGFDVDGSLFKDTD